MEDVRPDWLKSLAEKTWNLELLISGAATYFASYLPELTDKALFYFLDNFTSMAVTGRSKLPILAFSFLKVIAYLLPLTFVVHFIMRAFWASLVGVHTVYPQGILYDRLPGQKAFSKELYAKKFGPLSNYILRLDKLCNQIFGFAFVIVLFAVGLSLIYLILFGLILLSRAYFPDFVSDFILLLFMLLAILPAFAQQFADRINPEKYPRVVSTLKYLLMLLPKMMFPFIFTPFTYLSMIFSTNVSKRKFYTVLFGVMALVMAGAFFSLYITLSKLKRMDFHPGAQKHWGEYENRYTTHAESYEDKLPENGRVGGIMIPSEMVSGPLLKVFVSYTRSLDDALNVYCGTEPELSDSIPRMRRWVMQDSLKATCFTNNLSIMVNDSLFPPAEWVFQRHAVTGAPGVITYLPTQRFKPGKNVLTVQLPSATQRDSLIIVGEVPFWFGRE
jgi:hypothetical protein